MRQHVNEAGLKLLKEFEGCNLKAYPDPGTGADPWTIGWGHTGAEVHPGMSITQQRADELLKQDIETFERAVYNFVQVPMTENQFSALVCFAYNVGGWRGSTLFRLVRARKMHEAADEFPKWCHAGGKVLNGLVRRRAAERDLFLSE